MVNEIPNQLAEGGLFHPAYTAFPSAKFTEGPWGPQLSTDDKALGRLGLQDGRYPLIAGASLTILRPLSFAFYFRRSHGCGVGQFRWHCRSIQRLAFRPNWLQSKSQASLSLMIRFRGITSLIWHAGGGRVLTIPLTFPLKFYRSRNNPIPRNGINHRSGNGKGRKGMWGKLREKRLLVPPPLTLSLRDAPSLQVNTGALSQISRAPGPRTNSASRDGIDSTRRSAPDIAQKRRSKKRSRPPLKQGQIEIR